MLWYRLYGTPNICLVRNSVHSCFACFIFAFPIWLTTMPVTWIHGLEHITCMWLSRRAEARAYQDMAARHCSESLPTRSVTLFFYKKFAQISVDYPSASGWDQEDRRCRRPYIKQLSNSPLRALSHRVAKLCSTFVAHRLVTKFSASSCPVHTGAVYNMIKYEPFHVYKLDGVLVVSRYREPLYYSYIFVLHDMMMELYNNS